MKTVLLTLLFLLAPSSAHADCGPSNPLCIVPTAPVGTDNNQAASTAFVQGQASAQTSESGNFTVQTTDCNTTTFVFSSTSQATVTAAAASGFPANCKFWIVNSGSYTGIGSARGLILSSISGATFPSQGFILYPGQKTEFTNISNTWVETGYGWRQRWKPSANVTIFADASSGSDTASDCLASGASACATVGNGFNRIFNYIDLSGGLSQSTLSLNGTFSAGDVLHIAGPFPGGAGNAVFLVSGGTITTSAGNPCISIFDHATVEVSGVTCTDTSAGAGCFSVIHQAYLLFITSASTCNTSAGGAGVLANLSGSVEFVNVGLNFSGTAAAYLLFSATNSFITWDAAESIAFTSNVAFSGNTVFTQQNSQINFGGTTFNLNAHTITGTRYNCAYWALIFGTSGSPNTFIPGNANGTTGSDCETP